MKNLILTMIFLSFANAQSKILINEQDSEHTHSEHTTSETMEMPSITSETVKADDLTLVFNNYFELKKILEEGDINLTSTKATELVKSLENVQMNELKMDVHMVWMKVMKDLKADAKKIAKSKNKNSQRKFFTSLSNNMYSLIKIAKYKEPVI